MTLPPDFPAGDPPSIVAAVPVTDLNAFLDSARGLGIAVDDQAGVEGFSHKVTAPDGNTNLFVLQSKGYALFSLIPGGADKLKQIDPASWAPKGTPGAALAARVRLGELPQALKDQFLGQFKASIEQQEERKPGEKDAEYHGRIAAQKAGVATIEALVRDGDSIAMALDVDRKTSEMSLDLTVAAKPGTETAKALRGFQAPPEPVPVPRRRRAPGVLGEHPDGAGGPRELRGGPRFGPESGTAGPHARAAKPRGPVPGADEGQSGRGGTRRRAGLPALPGRGRGAAHYTMLAGLKVRNGKDFDRWFRDSVAQVNLGEKGFQVTLDAAKAADGTAIHQVSGPFDKNDANMARVLGKATLAFAFRDDAIVGAFGEDAAAAVRKAVEGLSVPPPPDAGAVEPVALVARLSGFDAFPDEEKEREAYRHASAEAFRGEAAKQDRVSLTLKGDGDAIRFRLAVDVPALKFLAAVGHASKD